MDLTLIIDTEHSTPNIWYFELYRVKEINYIFHE